jgi:Gram-negative bacterial TonB protein C-terminal
MVACGEAAMAATVTLAPSEALQCMTPSEAERAAIKYPPDALERKEGGVVRAEMVFADPAAPPSIKILNKPLDVLADAIKEQLRRYRVPCLEPGQRAVIAQDFRFDPSDGRTVLWSRPRDSGDADRERQRSCLAAFTQPDYPMAALRREEQGVVALKFTFTDGVNPPHVTVLDDTPHPSLIEAATRSVEKMRLPCHSGRPVSFAVRYDFKLDGGDRIVVRDMALMTFLRAVKDIRKAQVYFDFNEMKCPFDLRVELRQPTEDNRIGEVGESVSERTFFIDWLSRQRLVLPAKQQNRMIGQQFNLSVPCGTINLTDATGSGASQ